MIIAQSLKKSIRFAPGCLLNAAATSTDCSTGTSDRKTEPESLR